MNSLTVGRVYTRVKYLLGNKHVMLPDYVGSCVWFSLAQENFDERYLLGIRLICIDDSPRRYGLFHVVGTNTVIAGCRVFTIKQALNHWRYREYASQGQRTRAAQFHIALLKLKNDLKNGKYY